MGKNSDYLRATLLGLGLIALIVVGAHLYAYYNKQKEIIYQKDFHGVVVLSRVNGKFITSACTEMNANLKVTEKEVIVTLNGDTLKGIPLGLTADGGLIVKFSESLEIVIYKTDPDGDGIEVLIVDGPAETLILSTLSNCEDIAALLGQEQGK